MTELLHELLLRSAERTPDSAALIYRAATLRYGELAGIARSVANGLLQLELRKQGRVGVYLPKQPETVSSIFGIAAAGGVFVPINPLLRPDQVGHILRDCDVEVLITSRERAVELGPTMADAGALRHVVLTEGSADASTAQRIAVHRWSDFLSAGQQQPHRVIDMDMAAILYTSGSTGRPKGVVLSHRNMVTGARSVAHYLGNTPADRLLAVLPFSFDYGFSQLSTAFATGASVVLMDYLLARDVLKVAARERVTGLAGVPPLWVQLAELEWPAEIRESLQYITNSGGHMPRTTLDRLRAALPSTRVYLMYGLTEAFRSTYLPPEQLDERPDSIGKAIPNAEISVVRPDGTLCAADEPGELVHRGSLVALGYWNDEEKTRERFRPAPGRPAELKLAEMAVWSGDTVRMDADGYLYFIGRRDEMIKTSGYRVSPTEVEEVVYGSGLVLDAVAIGVTHPALGQAIVVIASANAGRPSPTQELIEYCRQRLPTYMQPGHVEWRDTLPRNPNGKFDRKRLSNELQHLFVPANS
jgi:acyl-CoA ligase (AMP-forming) (exosortase A-associated)